VLHLFTGLFDFDPHRGRDSWFFQPLRRSAVWSNPPSPPFTWGAGVLLRLKEEEEPHHHQ
jgi:hypothetical protein